MDFFTDRTIEISSHALDGLSERHKLLSANVANADTPGYKRVDLDFETSLSNVLGDERLKETKRQALGTGITYNMSSIGDLEAVSSENGMDLNEDSFKRFKPEMIKNDDVSLKPDGNNVNIEYEMAELAKNGMKYAAVSQLQGNQFKLLMDVTKGGGI